VAAKGNVVNVTRRRTKKKGAAEAAPDGGITILWMLGHPILTVKPQGRAKHGTDSGLTLT
jgi:hypothetical protein